MFKLDTVLEHATFKVRDNYPKLKGLAVRPETANKAIEDAVIKTGQKIMDELHKAYAYPQVSKKVGADIIQQYSDINLIGTKTIKKGKNNQDYVARDAWTTQRGTLEINRGEDGVRTYSRYTSPTGAVHETRYIAGVPEKVLAKGNPVEMASIHDATKGRIVKHNIEKDSRSYTTSISNEFADGSREFIRLNSSDVPLEKSIYLNNGDWIHVDLNENIYSYGKRLKHSSSDFLWTSVMHKDPVTGAVSERRLEKVFDDYGRDVRRLLVTTPDGAKVKNIQMDYVSNGEQNFYKRGYVLRNATFESEELGIVKLLPNNEISVGGKVYNPNSLRQDGIINTGSKLLTTNEQCFSELLGMQLEKNGISKELIKPNAANWDLM